MFEHNREGAAAAANWAKQLIDEAVVASRHVADLNARMAWCEGYLSAKGTGRRTTGDIKDVFFAAIFLDQREAEKE